MTRTIVLIPTYRGGGAEVISLMLLRHLISQGRLVKGICFNATGPYSAEFAQLSVDEYREPRMFKWPLILAKYRLNSDDLVISMIRSTSLVLFPFVNRIGRIICREANTLDNLTEMKLVKREIYLYLLKRVYRSDNVKLIYNSYITKNSLEKIGSHKNVVIPNPIRFNFKGFGEKNNKDNCIRIIHLGRFNKQKNHQFLVNLGIDLKRQGLDFVMDFYGDGPLRSYFKEKIKDLSLTNNIRIHQFTLNIESHLNHYDMLLLPSFYEGFGNVVLEALASGLSVITSENVGASYFIDHPKLSILPLNIIKWREHVIKQFIYTPSNYDADSMFRSLERFKVDKIFAEYLE